MTVRDRKVHADACVGGDRPWSSIGAAVIAMATRRLNPLCEKFCNQWTPAPPGPVMQNADWKDPLC